MSNFNSLDTTVQDPTYNDSNFNKHFEINFLRAPVFELLWVLESKTQTEKKIYLKLFSRRFRDNKFWVNQYTDRPAS